MLNARDAGGDLSRHKLVAAPRALMIKENAANAEHVVGFAVISRQLKARDFADAVRRTWMKRRVLVLGHLARLAEHFGRAGEIEAALRLQFAQSCQHIMSAVDVRIHGREAIGKTLGHE